jgi:uncharacterized protein
MPAASLITLIDDIATVLDDVAVLTKVAAKKTAGVLGDDLALNAEQVTGVRAERELPVVWAVAKGSAVNKVILVPAALAISALMPWLITPLLMIGGAFLCYEGFEKVAHRYLHRPDEDKEQHAQLIAAVADPAVDLVAFERDKIKGAVRTDFILSAEIVVIALGTVAMAPFTTRVVTLVLFSALMTAGVYGLVAVIVKLDDVGQYLVLQSDGANGAGTNLKQRVGAAILTTAPYLMKGLSIAGTAAMFLVGGGILAHGIPDVEKWLRGVEQVAGAVPAAGPLLSFVLSMLSTALLGIAAGGVILALVALAKRSFGRARTA